MSDQLAQGRATVEMLSLFEIALPIGLRPRLLRGRSFDQLDIHAITHMLLEAADAASCCTHSRVLLGRRRRGLLMVSITLPALHLAPN